MDSRAAGFLVAVVVFTGVGIGAVHSMQQQERANLHLGVIRDQQLLALKKQQQMESQQEQESSQQPQAIFLILHILPTPRNSFLSHIVIEGDLGPSSTVLKLNTGCQIY